MTGSYKPQFANRWDFDTMEGEDMDDFLEALEADELADDGEEDHEAALDAWREQQELDGGDELPCGLTRHQLRVAAKELFHGLSGVFDEILKASQKRPFRDGTSGSKNGALVSAAMTAGIAVALQLPRFEKSAAVARSLKVTRAGVSLYAAKFGRMLGTTSEQSAKKQRDGILAMARQKAGLKPKVGDVIHTHTAEDREPEAVKTWLESLPDDEKAEARKALKGRAA